MIDSVYGCLWLVVCMNFVLCVLCVVVDLDVW